MIRLPWTNESGPHLLLDVTAQCNISCRGCYKRKTGLSRTLTDIEHDLTTALALRRVQTVSIAGAEPTMHPQLPAIVSLIHRRGLRASLITNGVRLTDELLVELKQAGLDVVMLHVDEGQQRPDLPAASSLTEVNALRVALADRVAAHGVDAGLSVTLYPSTLERLPALVRLVAESRTIHFVFVTHYVDVAAMDLHEAGRTTNADVIAMLREHFGLEPFAGIGSWVSYFVPILDQQEFVPIRSSVIDAALLQLPRLLTGRHLFYYPAKTTVAAAQVTLNLLTHGRFVEAGRVLHRARELCAKRFIFDNGIHEHEDCRQYCPNPTIRDGQLVPVCVADYTGAA